MKVLLWIQSSVYYFESAQKWTELLPQEPMSDKRNLKIIKIEPTRKRKISLS